MDTIVPTLLANFSLIVEMVFTFDPRENGMLDWLRQAKCNGLPPSFFYCTDVGEIYRAKQFCEDCPVKIDCLEHAIKNHEDWGVWGGCSERERKTIRRHRVVLRVSLQQNKPHVQERPLDVYPLHLSCTLDQYTHTPVSSDSVVVLRVPSFDVA